MPGVGLVLCFLSSAATITLAERMPLADPADRAPVAFGSATGATAAAGTRAATTAAARPPSPPSPESRFGYSTISISSTSKASAAPGGIRPLARLSP